MPHLQLSTVEAADIATWLLRANVRQTRPLDTDLPGAPVAADQVYQVTLGSGQDVLPSWKDLAKPVPSLILGAANKRSKTNLRRACAFGVLHELG